MSLKNPKARYIKNIESINSQVNDLITQQLSTQQQKQLVHALQKVQHVTQHLKETLNDTPT